MDGSPRMAGARHFMNTSHILFSSIFVTMQTILSPTLRNHHPPPTTTSATRLAPTKPSLPQRPSVSPEPMRNPAVHVRHTNQRAGANRAIAHAWCLKAKAATPACSSTARLAWAGATEDAVRGAWPDCLLYKSRQVTAVSLLRILTCPRHRDAAHAHSAACNTFACV